MEKTFVSCIVFRQFFGLWLGAVSLKTSTACWKLASYCYIEIGDMSGFPSGKSKKFLFPSKFCFSTLNQVIGLLAQID
jgi:hypothetical protein